MELSPDSKLMLRMSSVPVTMASSLVSHLSWGPWQWHPTLAWWWGSQDHHGGGKEDMVVMRIYGGGGSIGAPWLWVGGHGGGGSIEASWWWGGGYGSEAVGITMVVGRRMRWWWR